MSCIVAFEASARHLSFTRAAIELSLTQSAVSRQVQILESLLGVDLFRREGRHIVLTEVGSTYLREMTGVLQRVRNASLQAIAYRAGPDSLHLAVSPTFANQWLMPRLANFYKRHPDILIHVHSRVEPFDLEHAGMDAAIGGGDGPWPNLECLFLLDEYLLPTISPSLAATKNITRVEDLKQHTLLAVSSRPVAWGHWFEANGVSTSGLRFGPQFEVTSHLIKAVAAGIGIGLLPKIFFEEESRAGTLSIAIDAPVRTGFSYYLFTPLGREHRPQIAAFQAWLMEEVALATV